MKSITRPSIIIVLVIASCVYHASADEVGKQGVATMREALKAPFLDLLATNEGASTDTLHQRLEAARNALSAYEKLHSTSAVRTDAAAAIPAMPSVTPAPTVAQAPAPAPVEPQVTTIAPAPAPQIPAPMPDGSAALANNAAAPAAVSAQMPQEMPMATPVEAPATAPVAAPVTVPVIAPAVTPVPAPEPIAAMPVVPSPVQGMPQTEMPSAPQPAGMPVAS